ncbi:MAG: TIM barrel protein [Kiritimatiellaeota bacterium]|nr:TIM barrel protein [Kiritimatiellota bacterium]
MKYGVCLEMVFTDRPFLDRIQLVAEAGYRFAEMWFGDLAPAKRAANARTSKQAVKVRAAAAKAGVTMTNAVIGSPDGGIGGGLTDAVRRAEWLKRTDATLAYCREANIGAAIVCTGNLAKGLSRTQMRLNVLDGLKATAERAEKAGITLLLEALNDKVDHPGYFLTSSDEGAALCREVNSPRLKLLFDCYHMQIMEGDLTGHLRKNLDVIGHIHSAGHPGRHELWLGETNYPFLVRQLEIMGCQGVFALEYTPTLPPSESLRKTLAYLTKNTNSFKISNIWKGGGS